MSAIFLCYRRDDSAGFAGRLTDALKTAFGSGSVFRDVDDIRPGEDFTEAIKTQLRGVNAVLVMIGPHWLTASADGRRRLDAADDFVHIEIQAALASGKTLIPLLVGGAGMPDEANLPPALAGLARRQAVVLSDANWRGDVERLVADLRTLLPNPDAGKSMPRTRRWVLAAAAAVTLLGACAGFYFFPDTTPTPPAPTAVRPPADIAGRWTARVKYDWGDEYAEIFEFKYLGDAIHGTASFLTRRRTIEHATLKDDGLHFTTRSHEMLKDSLKEVTHRYIGKVTPEGIAFTLEITGGYTIHPPIEFMARRVGK